MMLARARSSLLQVCMALSDCAGQHRLCFPVVTQNVDDERDLRAPANEDEVTGRMLSVTETETSEEQIHSMEDKSKRSQMLMIGLSGACAASRGRPIEEEGRLLYLFLPHFHHAH